LEFGIWKELFSFAQEKRYGSKASKRAPQLR
jgi:hypothetical protein